MIGVCRGEYKSKFGVVSHRWDLPNNPDPNCVQWPLIINWLKHNPSIEWLWVDYCCLWQELEGRKKTPEQSKEFKSMLINVNLLYLGMRVLILMDRSTISRFWTVRAPNFHAV